MLQVTYAGFEPAVPAFAWDRIEAKLDSKKRRGLAWWKLAAAVLLITGAVAVIMHRQRAGSEELSASGNHKTQQEQTNAKPESNKNENNQENSKATSTSPNAGSSGNANGAHGYPGHSTDAGQEQSGKQPQNANTNDQANPIDQPDQPAQEATTIEESNVGANLEAFGPRSEEMDYTDARVLDQESNGVRIKNNILPPDHVMGARTMMGIGVGQMVSRNGYAINPKYGAYVHKDFLKNIRNGEGLLGALSFSGSIGYRVAGNHYIFSGVNYYQRKNSIRFDFNWNPPVTTNANGEQPDKNGNYPIVDYMDWQTNTTKFTGTNTFTEFDIPIGWFAQINLNKKYTFIPSVSANMGFISIGTRNVTLDYAIPEVVGVNKDWYRRRFALMSASAGIYRNIGPILKWGVNVAGNYTLTQMYDAGSTIRPRAFTGGFNTQLIWRLD